MNIVEIQWIDSMSEGTWLTVKEAIEKATPDAMRHRTVGYVLEANEDSILLVMGQSEQGDGENRLVHSMMQIPRVAIVEITDLEPVELDKPEPGDDL